MSNSVATVSYDPTRFALEMPDRAPAMGFDVNAETFNWRDVMPSNYFNMDDVMERKDRLGGWPVFTPARIVIKPVYDPSEWDGKEIPASELIPKVVMEFEEHGPALVFNRTRCEQATEATGTPDPRRWAELIGPVSLVVGVFNKKAQIGIVPVTATARPNGKARPASAPTVTGRKLKAMSDGEISNELFG